MHRGEKTSHIDIYFPVRIKQLSVSGVPEARVTHLESADIKATLRSCPH